MAKPKTEVKCDACSGTGSEAVTQPDTPGRRIYPPRCKKCHGKGVIPVEVRLALLWQNLFVQRLFKDLSSAVRAPLSPRPQDEI
ncbi:hypothetical protein, partial [Bradyrhizobium sp. NAS80.1]|uniref:hypothetical protein n=1 Tax=Bradyrhizobium sp. NAS80.1 TaxID=1680159 RepID=UPI001AF0022C